MISQFFVVAALSLAAVEVEIRPLEGEPVVGSLVAFDARELVVETESGRQTFDVANLVRVNRRTPAEVPDEVSDIVVELTDGSRLSCRSYAVTKGKAVVALGGGGNIEIPTSAIHSVRLRKQDEANLRDQWRAIDQREATGDRIVVRKTTTEKVKGEDEFEVVEKQVINLDWLEGVIYDVSDETVSFKFNDSLIPVKRERIEGIFYFHAAGGKPADPVCIVNDAAGSSWSAKSLALADGNIELTSTSNVKTAFPVERLAGLDYSGGKIVFLSEVEPDRFKWTSDFGRREPSEYEVQWFGPRSIEKYKARELYLGRRKIEKGLLVHSRTELVYRVGEGMKRLLATVGIEDNVRIGGRARLSVVGDGETLFDQPLTAQDEKPTALDVDITGVRRLTVLVDFGDEVGIGDQVILSNVRMTK